jgi:hypothetical protein
VPANFTPFAGSWDIHGTEVTIANDGRGLATWRTYRWCTDDPRPGCDNLQGDVVTPGGMATLQLTSATATTAVGRVLTSTDAALPVGPIAPRLLPGDHLFINAHFSQLCGPQAPTETCGA